MGRWVDDLPHDEEVTGKTHHKVIWHGEVTIPLYQRDAIRTIIETAGDTFNGITLRIDDDELTCAIGYGPAHGANMSDVGKLLERNGIDVITLTRSFTEHVTDGSCEKAGCDK